MRTQTVAYKRPIDFNGGYKIIEEKNILGALKSNIIMLLTAFLMGRVSFLGGMMPLGLALYAASIGSDVSRTLLAVMAIGGMVTAGAGGNIIVSAAAMILFNILNMFMKNNRWRTNIRYSITAMISILIPGLISSYLHGFLLYDILKEVLQGFIVFSIVFIFRNSIPILTESRKPGIYTNEEIISIAIFAALTLAGMGSIQLFGFSIRNIVSILIVILLSYKCGPGVGAATGVTLGLIESLSSNIDPYIIGTFAFCGLLTGIFKKLGKVGAALGFIIGNALLTIYMRGAADAAVHLKEITAAVMLFIIMPAKFIDLVAGRFGRNTDTVLDKDGYSLRIKEMTVDRLNKFSNAFKQLSTTFSEIAETNVVTSKQDITALFDRVADKVCRDCSLCLHCWDRNFYNTYQVLFKIIERIDEKGRIEESDIPDYFIDRCERINDFVDAVNSVYEIFKVNMVWKSKIGESRGLVSQQLEGLSRVVSNLASEIDINVRFNGELEDTIIMELNKIGIKASEAIVTQNKWGKYEISVFHKGCGGRRNCISSIEEAVSKMVGKKMVREGTECYNISSSNSCNLRLVEEETFKVTTGIARTAKNNNDVSGDNYSFMNTGDGKYIVAISDGMGSGEKASTQSRATINLLEQFMEAGFDKDTTIKLINSILVLRSNDDSFATIDLAVVDLYDGKVEFVKTGAVPTFIKRAAGVECIRSVSLPAGILSNIDVELDSRNVDSGEFVIMMTDGIIDSFRQDDEDGIRLVGRFIEGIETVNPQEIADLILREAYNNSNGDPMDDMTVMVAKLWKKAG